MPAPTYPRRSVPPLRTAPDVVVVVLAPDPPEPPPQAASSVPSPTTPAVPFRKSDRESCFSPSMGSTRGSGPEVTLSSRLVAARGPVRCHRRPDERELVFPVSPCPAGAAAPGVGAMLALGCWGGKWQPPAKHLLPRRVHGAGAASFGSRVPRGTRGDARGIGRVLRRKHGRASPLDGRRARHLRAHGRVAVGRAARQRRRDLRHPGGKRPRQRRHLRDLRHPGRASRRRRGADRLRNRGPRAGRAQRSGLRARRPAVLHRLGNRGGSAGRAVARAGCSCWTPRAESF